MRQIIAITVSVAERFPLCFGGKLTEDMKSDDKKVRARLQLLILASSSAGTFS